MIAFVGWRPIRDDGAQEWVQMGAGSGERAWWHRHPGEHDYGGNPVDDGKCRTCGVAHPHEEGYGA